MHLSSSSSFSFVSAFSYNNRSFFSVCVCDGRMLLLLLKPHRDLLRGGSSSSRWLWRWSTLLVWRGSTGKRWPLLLLLLLLWVLIVCVCVCWFLSLFLFLLWLYLLLLLLLVVRVCLCVFLL